MSQSIKFGKISFLLFLGLITFFYLITTTLNDIYYVITNPAAGFTPVYNKEIHKIVVGKMIPNGPAAHAGVRVGDIILNFNKTELTDPESQLSVFEKIEVGDILHMTILRGTAEREISFEVKRHLLVHTKTVLLQLFPGLIFCYALCLIGIFVFLKQIQQPMAHIFYLMLLTWAVAMMHFVFSLGNPSSVFPSWIEWLINPTMPLAAGLMLHFYLIFPVPKTFFKRFPAPILFSAYAPALILLFLQVYFHYKTTFNLPRTHQIWMLSLIPVFMAAILVLVHSIWKAPTPYARRQAQIVFIGTVVGLGLPAGVFFFLGNVYSPFYLLTLLWPVSLAYAIVKHRFMNVDVIIRRGVAYAIMSGFVIAAYFVLVVGIGQVFITLAGTESQLVIIISTLLIALAFNPVRQRVKEFIDRRFYPARYTYRESLRTFSHQLVNVIDLQKLLRMLVDFLSTNIGINPIVIFWYNPGDKSFFIREATGLNTSHATTLPFDSFVISRLLQTRQLVDLTAIRHKSLSMQAEELTIWESLKAEIVLPLNSRKGLVGALILGQKNERDPYFNEDIQLLETLSDQIQIAIENALLTDDLREQERLRKELEVARKIQLSLLPQIDPHVPGLDVSGISIPAMEVGGDYYDYLHINEQSFCVVIGDVSGKGTSAALYMSQLKGMLKALSHHNKSLAHMATELNALTYSSLEAKSYITLMLASFQLQKNEMRLIRAGHLPLLHHHKNENRTSIITPNGIGVGLDAGTIFHEEIEEVKVKFSPGDIFIFTTDGIVETANDLEEEFEFSSLQAILQSEHFSSARECRDNILSKVRAFANNGIQKDDMTLVVVRVPD
ncbi:MAG: SpoIIE family protein phosphatase [Deferribacteres bacterium]|nr:SpoIIE family protein phosphatase [candidate division KSB1 bacterium]MCB9503780.1 SpoIIE family protein phosphatase [Deferribacteres bacterium]